MFNVELLLRSRLVNDTLSAALRGAGFSVIQEQDRDDRYSIVIIDLDDYRQQKVLCAHQSRGAKIVALVDEADSLAISAEDIVPLSGVLTYELSTNAFVHSLRRICSGERVFPEDRVPRQDLPTPSPGVQPQFTSACLSPCERRVLAHLVEGDPEKVIARQLGMTEAEVELHLKSLLCKIRLDNRTEATIWALTNLPELKLKPRGFI